MTDEELIERLRRMSPRLDMLDCEDVLTAADRIEQLVKERDETHEEGMAAIEMWGAALKGQRAAEAKLAKAVEALRQMLEDPEYWSPYARATLAELEKTE
jgi:tetrahydromethanopterin S-methyltransferase subunit A